MVSDQPGVCQDATCSNQGKPFQACVCEDGSHVTPQPAGDEPAAPVEPATPEEQGGTGGGDMPA